MGEIERERESEKSERKRENDRGHNEYMCFINILGLHDENLIASIYTHILTYVGYPTNVCTKQRIE